MIILLWLGVITCLSAQTIPLYPDSKDPALKKVTLTAYPTSDTTQLHPAMIICPGGSYSWLDEKIEGQEVAEYFAQNGISCFVLHYRVANVSAYVLGYRVFGLGNRWPVMLDDAQTALEWVYRHAEDYRIDTTRIGVLGFSAGGHLAMSTEVYNTTAYRPAFVCAIYPVVTMADKRYVHRRSRRGALGVWGQFDKTMQDRLSLERHIPEGCPPVMMVSCADDKVVDWHNTALLDSALTAHHIEHLWLHYATGGHGFGVSATKGTEESRQWKQQCKQWILNLNQ